MEIQMKSKSFFTLSILCLGSAAFAQELIQNGSFENPVIAAPFQTVNAGQTTIQFWNVGRTSVDIVSTTFNPAFPSRDGNQHIDLAGSPGPGLISQFFGTTSGETYRVRFSASSNGSAQLFELWWQGSAITTPLAPAQGTWQDYEFMLFATMPGGMIGFGSTPGNNTNQGPLVDNVSVQLVPEPATLIACGFGIVGAISRRRARRR
jgi:hypothetical protein